jgi:hypothetical protein
VSRFDLTLAGPAMGIGGAPVVPAIWPDDSVVTGFTVYCADTVNRFDLFYTSQSTGGTKEITQSLAGEIKAPAMPRVTFAADEYIMSMAVDCHAQMVGSVYVVRFSTLCRMTITTNVRSYPYTASSLNTTSSFDMTFPSPGQGAIAGLFGRTNGGAIDAIGFVLRILKP